MTAYIVYDQNTAGNCVGIMTSEQLAKFLRITRNSIYKQISRGDRVFLRRYEVVRCWIDPDDYIDDVSFIYRMQKYRRKNGNDDGRDIRQCRSV